MEIVNKIVNDNLKKCRIFSIRGRPGTGKSLVTYHIAKILYNKNKRVIIIHEANINDGQCLLNEHGFKIKPIKEFPKIIENIREYDYVILDEAQRLRKEQITKLIETIKISKTNFIISFDPDQTLSPGEDSTNIEELEKFILEHKGNESRLSNKFRTNPEMNKFIQLLFKFSVDNLESIDNSDKKILVKFFSERKNADEYLEKKLGTEWTVLNYTKSQYSNERLSIMNSFGLTSHAVIGQEFNNVIIPMDANFKYVIESYTDDNGVEKQYKKLKTTKSYYPIEKMLYQNLTRTREKLEIVIIENSELFIDICKLLKKI